MRVMRNRGYCGTLSTVIQPLLGDERHRSNHSCRIQLPSLLGNFLTFTGQSLTQPTQLNNNDDFCSRVGEPGNEATKLAGNLNNNNGSVKTR